MSAYMFFLPFIGGKSANKGLRERVPIVPEAVSTLLHFPLLAENPPIKGNEMTRLRYFDGAICLLNFGAGQRAAHVFNGPQNSHEEKNKEDSPFRN